MPPVLVVSGEQLGGSPAGTALRAAGLARALARRGHDVVVAVPAGSEPPEGCRVASLEELPALAPACSCAVVSGFQLEQHPALQEAPYLCADLAGPFLVENLWVHRGEAARLRRRVLADEADVAAGLIEHADLILCAHDRQRDLLVGMLLARGALRPELLERDPGLRDLLVTLPFGAPEGDPPPRPPARTDGPLRLLWPGGQWPWLDVVTLQAAVQQAGSAAELELWGGGGTWVPYAERVDRLVAADVAVTLDPGGLESRYAFRTRLLDALWAGVPTLATAGEHVADEAAAAGAGWTVKPGDVTGLAALLSELAAERARVAAAAGRARAVAARYRCDDLIEPLHRFCLHPVRRRPGPWQRGLRHHAGRALARLLRGGG